MATHRILRILKHRLWDERDAHRLISPDVVARLQAQVTGSERHHSGEIRVCVEASLPLSYLWRGLQARDRAITMFGKLRVWDTEANNGVLIYLLIAERAIEIIADRALARRVPGDHWQTLVGGMREAFGDGRYEQGLAAAIAAVDALLVQHFPLAAGQANVNELPDQIDLR